MKIKLPYGNELVYFEVKDEMFAGMYDSVDTSQPADPFFEVTRAIENPIGTPKLEQIVKPESTIAIIIDDGSRPTPIKLILPPLLKKLETIGVKKQNIKIVVALGSHRYMTEEELCDRVGEAVYKRYKVINSEFKDPDKLVFMGKTPDGVDIFATKEITNVDIRIGVGNLVPHPVMGWSGGGKILYPGVAGEETVAYFHLKGSLLNRNLFGDNTSPIREMMESWVKTIGLDFIVNTILTPKLQIFKAVAGHYIEAQRAGVEIGKKELGFKIPEKVDIVVVSSHPADQDFWQSPKGMFSAEHALKGESGGTIILVSPNYEGIGPHAEFPACMSRDDIDDMVKDILAGKDIPGDRLAIGIGNGMSKMRRRRKLVVVSDGVTAEEMKICGCKHYKIADLQKAIDDAIQEYPDCRVAAVSNGAESYLYY